jgi:hypothetical protein
MTKPTTGAGQAEIEGCSHKAQREPR